MKFGKEIWKDFGSREDKWTWTYSIEWLGIESYSDSRFVHADVLSKLQHVEN